MCGIWAVFGLDTNLYKHCGTSFTRITHRGPDAWRVEYDARVKVNITSSHYTRHVSVTVNQCRAHFINQLRELISMSTLKKEEYNYIFSIAVKFHLLLETSIVFFCTKKLTIFRDKETKKIIINNNV